MAISGKTGRLAGLKLSDHESESYDSLLERDYMLELENTNGIKRWTKNHKIRIPYYIFGIRKTYLPDFLVTYQDGSRELHETKGAGFLSWISTHYKRHAGDEWCKKNGMKYKFIENSNGALFAQNNTLNSLDKTSEGMGAKKFDSIDELINEEKN